MTINRKDLLSITKPGRYCGGELGAEIENKTENLKIALCFPDLYEIGMSNYALKIIYNLLNTIPGIQCERVFAPFPDYEELLRKKDLPLTTLENNIPLCDCDILAFTVGYELQATNILNVLELGKISLRIKDRNNNSPYIIAGGPSVTNPLPLSPFIDSFYMGEVEAGFSEIIEKVKWEKENFKGNPSFGRMEISRIFESFPMIWSQNKREAVRTVQADFATNPVVFDYFPVPSIQIVQEHGSVEIMRGCPNKCRFCHAGVYYRPMRQKSIQMILDEVDFLVNQCGYTSISLASLSSGDYSEIENLINLLHQRYRLSNITFSVPSLRVNSLNLSLIEKLSHGKKSGLTFAIETPVLEWQRSINKVVDKEKIIELLRLAKSMGWKSAKFYFMIGLPESANSPDMSEIEEIAAYLTDIREAVRINLTVNVGLYIPKPHTVYEEAQQLDWQQALTFLSSLKRGITDRGIKVSYQDPFSSFIEGVFSRGGEATGDFIEEAFKRGARFDAWSDHFNKDLWREIFSENTKEELDKILSGGYREDWNGIDLRLNSSSFNKEKDRSNNSETTINCDYPCKDHCGVCKGDLKVEKAQPFSGEESLPVNNNNIPTEPVRLKIRFSKKGRAIYWGHLDVVELFIRAFLRSGLKLKYSEGFRPKPRLEFASPLSLGIFSEYEIVSADLFDIDISDDTKIDQIQNLLNKNLPPDISIEGITAEENCHKETKVTRRFWGSKYLLEIEQESPISPVEFLNRIESLIEENKAGDFYHLQPDGNDSSLHTIKMNTIKITAREFDSQYRIMKLLKELYETNLPLANPIKLTRVVSFEKGDNSGGNYKEF